MASDHAHVRTADERAIKGNVSDQRPPIGSFKKSHKAGHICVPISRYTTKKKKKTSLDTPAPGSANE